MIDYHSTLVNALNSILPTHYEMALTSKTKTPCISYMELSNYVSESGDTLEYSLITYRVKVWGNDIGELQKYALQIDDKMRELGFKRIPGGGELYDKQSTMIQKILNYEALASETY